MLTLLASIEGRGIGKQGGVSAFTFCILKGFRMNRFGIWITLS